ncbi:pregnancy-associated plasma protein-A domain-containing protein [Hirsutella rhossiliensis]|uniref:Pregnancy-associated plasma protein-A domain-containing protein n=1 Tax=Hirsutella rhossiliensis TaxID=111463 RepID=A0A9P8MNU0_9HYPO|nr:pregnancy-associated plasma protein-A domain-containing protein [Hirsutella rhossiliensis]KAH0958485.1 pregnancy-associated plasma protein-A domain-containing protein [Hirsutella rhossiliensis]
MLPGAVYSALGLLAATSLVTAQEEEDLGYMPRDTSEMLSAPPELISLSEQLEKIPPSIALRFGEEEPVIQVPVQIIVISAQEKSAADFPQDDILRQQIQVLNNAFKPHFEFELNNITRKVDANWAGGGDNNNMKTTLHQGDHKTLNLYFTDQVKGSDGGDALGTCHYPTIVRTNPKSDGCSLRTDTLPSGRNKRYNLGITAVHEVGHFLGLAHTFDGGCKDGDKVADTPPEAKADYSCDTNLHSCGDARPDPVHNFMDYGPDSCLDNFTPLQFQRMRRMWEHLRAPAVPPRQLNAILETCLQYATDDNKCKEILKTCIKQKFPNGNYPNDKKQQLINAVLPCVKETVAQDNAILPPDKARRSPNF